MINRFTKSESTVRHAIHGHIPSFYQDEGPNFVLFVEKYFQHLETDVLSVGRNLQSTGDIDVTADEFLVNFNNKYTFGQGQSIRTLPGVITGDLRFIIKHIKDIYRSKGTNRGIKLFFRVAFNDSPEIFTPGERLFRPSDSTFFRPDIIEIDDGALSIDALRALPGTQIIGSVSGARATVNDFFVKRVGEKKFNYLTLSNITGTFVLNDKITAPSPTNAQLTSAPKVTGPVSEIEVVDGSVGIPAGTSFESIDGRELKVSATDFEFLIGTFDLTPIDGTKYTNLSSVVITRAPLETTGLQRGTFTVVVDGADGTEEINGSLIGTVSGSNINSTTMFGSALNLTEAIGDTLSFETRRYGNIEQARATTFPQFYTKRPFVRVVDLAFSRTQAGTVDIVNTAITGTGTAFDSLMFPVSAVSGTANVTFGDTTVYGVGSSFNTELNVNDVIRVDDVSGRNRFLTVRDIKSATEMEVMEKPDFTSSNAAYNISHKTYIKLIDSVGNEEIRVVNNAVSNTSIFLDDEILDSDSLTETTGLTFQMGYESERSFDIANKFGPTVGKDAEFEVDVVAGQGSVKDVYILNSGFGFNKNENVTLLSDDMTPQLDFTNSDGTGADGYVTIENGVIVSATLTSGGTGYDTAPVVRLTGGTGTGATLQAEVSGGVVTNVNVTSGGTGYRIRSTISVRPIKSGQSILEGRTIRPASEPSQGMIIQDSNFWQEYSYEIRSSIDGTKYEDIVQGLMHMSGRKMFTRPFIKDIEDNSNKVITDSVTAG